MADEILQTEDYSPFVEKIADELMGAQVALYPISAAGVSKEQGAVRQHINIFVGDEAIRFADGLSTKVPADPEVLIVPAVSGG
jgi:molybdopterin converting factor small subunit